MSGERRESGLVLTSPNAIGLPAVERGRVPAPATRALVAQHWPRVEDLLAERRAAEAIVALESLAGAMRRSTAADAEPFLEALTVARRVLYDDIVVVGRSAGREQEARAALARCARWDEELAAHLVELAR